MASWKKILTDSVGTSEIENDSVTNAKITDEAIDNNKLADNAVTTSAIADDAVTSAKIANNTIIANNMDINNTAISGYPITFAPSGSGLYWTQIGTGAIQNDAVTADKLANGSVSGDILTTNAINSSSKLGTGVVTASKIASNAITNTKIDNDAISASKIQDETITADKLADGVIPTAHNYVVFNHNFADDIGTTEIYIPWTGISESSTAYVSNSYMLVPFTNMKFRRLMFRIHTVNQLSASLTVDLKRIQNNSTTVSTMDTVNLSISYYNNYGSYTVEDGTGSSQLNYTASLGEMVGFSVDASIDWAGHSQYFATSVWEIEGTSIG